MSARTGKTRAAPSTPAAGHTVHHVSSAQASAGTARTTTAAAKRDAFSTTSGNMRDRLATTIASSPASAAVHPLNSEASPTPAVAANTATATVASTMLRCTSVSAPSTSERRSEEHTSELQSRENLVCRLLLEKKN